MANGYASQMTVGQRKLFKSVVSYGLKIQSRFSAEPASIMGTLVLFLLLAAAPFPARASAATAPASLVPPDLQQAAQDAKNAFDHNQFQDAQRIYEQMLTKAPNNVYILSNLGVVYFRNEKWKLAEDSLKKAIAVAPKDAFSHCTLGIVYYQEKRYDDAINELTQSLAIDPKYAVAHNYLGVTEFQKGWLEAARKELQTAIELDPNYDDPYRNMQQLLHLQTLPAGQSDLPSRF